MITETSYQGLRVLTQLLLPLVGTVIFVVAGPNVAVGVIMVAMLVLSMILWGAQRVYARRVGRGDLLIHETEDGTGFVLQLERTPEELVDMHEVRFEVKRQPSPT
jgi:hypothetical protein